MPHYKKITGERCYLSPLSHEDAAAHTAWENDLSVGIPLGDEAYTPTSLERMHEQIDGALRNQSHVFSIVALDSEQTIGRCMLTNLDAINRIGDAGHHDRPGVSRTRAMARRRSACCWTTPLTCSTSTT